MEQFLWALKIVFVILTITYFSHLYEFQSEALLLQLVVRLRRLLVHQLQLRVLSPLEEVEVPDVVLGVVDSLCGRRRDRFDKHLSEAFFF